MKQADIAKPLGMSVASYSRIESGKTNLNINLLKKICKVLNVELIEVLENNIQFLSESKTGYGKAAAKKIQEQAKDSKALMEENNLLLKTILNLLEQQKEINNRLIVFLKESKK